MIIQDDGFLGLLELMDMDVVWGPNRLGIFAAQMMRSHIGRPVDELATNGLRQKLQHDILDSAGSHELPRMRLVHI